MLTTSPQRSAIGVDRTFSEVTADVGDGKIFKLRSDPDRYDLQTLWWFDHRPSGNRILYSSAGSKTLNEPDT